MNRSAVIAIASPALVVLMYAGLWVHARNQAATPRPQLTPQQSRELWDRCNSLFQQGKYAEALPAVLELHESYPNDHFYIERAAEIYDHLGQYTEEATFWEKYFDRAPNPLTACPQIGDAYAKAGKQPEALAALERCLSLDPENPDSIFFMAHALERAGNFDRAAALYRRGMALAPGYLDLQIGLARVLLRQGKLEAAEAQVASVLQRSPRNVDALLVTGLVCERQGKLAQAKRFLRRGVALSDGYLDFHAALAGIAEEEKDFAEAIRQYDRILQERPDDQSIRSRRDALKGKP